MDIQDFPMTFCVPVRKGTQNGYYLLRWSHGGLDAQNKIIHILKPANHRDRYYNISNILMPVRINEIITKKGNGTVTRSLKWQYTAKSLRYNGDYTPILKINSLSSLPSMKITSFIPIREAAPPVAPPVPVVPVVPVVPTVQPIRYTITSIPQHTVRALLRDAAMEEEVCPITSEEIDVTNGAVTSCFHLFEKNAIAKWLLLPNSRDKCPTCNAACNYYMLNDEPPHLDTHVTV